MCTIVQTVREALKTFGRPLFGKLSTRIFESITMSPRSRDSVSVNEIAGLWVYITFHIKKLLDRFDSLLFHLEDYMCSFISFTGLSVARPLNYYLEAM